MQRRLIALFAIVGIICYAAACNSAPKAESPSDAQKAMDLVREGRLAAADEDFEAARKAFARALVHDSRCVEAAYHLGKTEERAGNPEKALVAFRQVGQIDANHELSAPARERYNHILSVLFAGRIADEVAQLGDRSIAVLDFTGADGQPNYLGTLFGQELTAAISGLGKPEITLVERKRMKDLLAEKMLDESDLVDRQRMTEARKFIPADIFVTGKVLEKTFISVIEKDTGRVLLQDSRATFGGGKTKEVSASWKQLAGIRNHKPGFAVKLWTNGPRGEAYHEGDTVSFHFLVEKPSYVFLYALNPDGSMVQLHPNPFSKLEKLEAGKEYVFPPEDAPFDIPIEPPLGLHQVKMIACTKNVDPFTKKLSPGELRPISKDDDVTMRSLRIRLDTESPAEWAETTIRFPTIPKTGSP